MSCTLTPPTSHSGHFNGTNIEISWSAVAGAYAYRVVITDKTTREEFFNRDISGTSISVPNASPQHEYSYSIHSMCNAAEVSVEGIIDDVVH